MEQFAYYYDNVRISKQDYELLSRYTPNVSKTNLYHDTNTGNHELNNILLSIQTDSRLSEKLDEILNRIEKNGNKLTLSTSQRYDFVEIKLLLNLFDEAIGYINKHTDDSYTNATYNYAYEYLYTLGFNDDCSYNSSLRSKLSKYKRIDEEIYSIDYDSITYEPKVEELFNELTKDFDINKKGWFDAYREFHIDGERCYGDRSFKEHGKPNFVGKLYYSDVFKTSYTQLYLYLPKGDLRPLKFAIACYLNKNFYTNYLESTKQNA